MDDDVVIKIAADIAEATTALTTLVGTFTGIGEALKSVDAQAETTGAAMGAMFEGLQQSVGTSHETLDAFGQKLVEVGEQGGEGLRLILDASQDVNTSLGDIGIAADITAGSVADLGGALSDTVEGSTEASGGLRLLIDDVATVAESASTADQAFLPFFEHMEDGAQTAGVVSDALTVVGDSATEMGEAVTAADEAQMNFFEHLDDGVNTTRKLAEALDDLTRQREADAESFSKFTQEQKEETAALTEELLKQGKAFKEIAEASGLTVNALKLLVTEQAAIKKATDDATEASKNFFVKWLEGVEASQVATVTWGVVLADAFMKFTSGIYDAITALPNMVTAAARTGDELNTLANRIGVTVDAIGRLKFVADEANVPMESLARTAQGLATQLTDSGSKASKMFEKLGLDAKALSKEPEEALYSFVDALKAVYEPAEADAKFLEILGGKARNLTPLLDENVEELKKLYRELGLTAEEIKALAVEGEKWGNNLGRMKLATDTFQQRLAMVFLPTLNAIAEKLPMLGGAVLTLGQGFVSTAQTVLPLITNIAALTSTKLAAAAYEWVSGLTAFTTATRVATTAVGLFQAAIWPVTLALAALTAAWYIWTAAAEDDGWQRNLVDWFEYQKLVTMGWTRDAALKEVAIRREAANAEHLAKKLKDQADQEAKLSKIRRDAAGGQEQFLAHQEDLLSISQSLSEAQQQQIIRTTAAQGNLENLADFLSQELNLNLADTKQVIAIFNAELKKTEALAKRDPFVDMMKDAKKLGIEMAAAAKQGIPLNQQIVQFGKEAAAIADRAALHGALAKIPPVINEVAQAFRESEFATAMKEINKDALELSKTFEEKMDAAVRAGNAAMTASINEMSQFFLSESEKRQAAIKAELDAKLVAMDTERVVQQKLLDERTAATEITLEAEMKAAQERIGVGKKLSEAEIQSILERQDADIKSAQARYNAWESNANNQMGLARMQADFDRMIADKATADFEKDAAAHGLITKKKTAEEQKLHADALEFMKKHRELFTTFAIAQYERLVAGAKSAYEQEAEFYGLVTNSMRDQELKKQEDKLAYMERNHVMFGEFSELELRQQKQHVDMLSNEYERSAKERGITTQNAARNQLAIEEQILAEMMRAGSEATAADKANQQKKVEASRAAAGVVSGDWGTAMTDIATSFNALATVMPEGFKGIAETVTQVTGQLDKMKGGFQTVTGMFKPGAMQGIKESFGGLMGGKGFGGAIKGLMGGLGSVMPMVGGIIEGITAAIDIGKKLWDVFTKSDAEAAAEEVGRDFGVAITEEMGQAIADTADELFSGDRFAASVYKLSDIVKEAGGVTADNFDKLIGKLRDSFSLMESGAFTAEQAREVLDKNFGAFAKHVVDSGKVASAQFQEIIQLNATSGLKSGEVIKFVGEQTTRLGGALAKMGGAVDNNAKSVARFERLTVAGFNAAIAAGVPYIDAINQMGPALDAIVEKHKELKIKGGDAINELLKFRNLTVKHKELVEGAGALNEVMLALSNTGGLNVKTFKDLQSQGVSTYKQLRDAGFSEQQSLMQMKGFLEGVRDSHEELGLPISKNTQKLIDQATAAGVMGEKQMSTNDVLMTGFAAIIEAVGGALPEAFTKFGKAAQAAAKKAKAGVDKTGEALEDTAGLAGEDVPEGFDAMAEAGVDAATTVANDLKKKTGESVTELTKLLVDTPWEDYGAEGMKAAKLVEEAIKDLSEEGITDVGDKLDDTDWGGWADDAVSAARRAKKAIDAVSLGESPGGIKEMPIKLKDAVKAFGEWERHSVRSAGSVKSAVDAVSGGAAGTVVGVVGGGGGGAAGSKVEYQAPMTLNFAITATNAQGLKQAVEQEILPLILDAVDRNNRGSLTKLRQLISEESR